MEWETQYPSVPSTPNSFSSQSTSSGNPVRADKVPSLKQLSPSPSVISLSKLSDEDLRRKGKEELLAMLREVETDYKALLAEHGNVVKDVNRRYQIFVLESRNLKEVNQKLQDDNQELRDLCCFLDDDRQRGRKLAREWQRFGRYTASVMRSEVAVYQEKLRELEQRQSELVTENMELKELCLFLDQERTRISGDRDEGDGSSNGTTVQEDGILSSEGNAPSHSTNGLLSTGSSNYLRELEQKVQKLEEEKRILAKKVSRNNADGLDGSQSVSDDATLVQESMASSAGADEPSHGLGLDQTSSRSNLPGANQPDAVVHAMKVLQVHEELEKTSTQGERWDDREKAILREMCNVVWRKLGDVGDVGSFNDSSDSPLTSPLSRPPHADLAHGMQGKTQPFSLSQPQPQMSSTPITSSTNVTSTNQPSNPYNPNAHVRPEPSQPRMSPTKSFQISNTQHQIQTQKGWPHQTDQRVDAYTSGLKDHAPSNFRPGSPMKKHESDQSMYGDQGKQPKPNQALSSSQSSAPHQQSQLPEYQYSAPTKHFIEDEKLPPHFLPHRRQAQPLPSYTSPQQQPPQYPGHPVQPRQPFSKSTPHLQTPYNPPSLGQGQQSQFQMPRSSSSSSAPATTSSRSSVPYHNQQDSFNSQQNPQHRIQLLDAPGIHQPKYETRSGPREDTYSSQQFQKHNYPHEMVPQRRDEFRSESNVSKTGLITNPLQNQNKDPRQRQRQDHFPSGYPPDPYKGPQALPSQSIHPHEDYKPSQPPSNNHPGGFSAYPPTSVSGSRGQYPVPRPAVPLHKNPASAQLQPRPRDGGVRKTPQINYTDLNQYNNYESESL